MARQDKPVTLKDVAAEAGVSQMTVSNVLNGKGGLSEATRTRVLAIARRLGYRPNQIARSLRADATQTFGVVVSDSSQLVFAKVIRGIEQAAAAAGYSVIVANTDQNAEQEKRSVELLLAKRIDGLILAAPLRTADEELQELIRFGVPLVLLMRSSDLADISSVGNDNEGGGYAILSYLLASGSRDIYYLCLPEPSQSGRRRIQGYRRALAAHGLALDPARLIFCQASIESGYRAMHEILAGGARGGAICCGCDLIAIGAMQALREQSRQIPAEFRVTGYDDIDLAEHLSVPLTTMRQPKELIGRTGVELLIRQIRAADWQPQQIILPSILVIRQSA
jgi:DNA-binding LacI/PurR family transcriptional regulator